jgi:hypothetical protein
MAVSIRSGLTAPEGALEPRPNIDMVVRVGTECGSGSQVSHVQASRDRQTLSVVNSMGETTTLSVHRCRFVDFNPSSITALAFPPLPLPSSKGKKKAIPGDRIPKFPPLIVGHANGNIEIYEWTGSTETVEAPQAWVVRKVRVRSFSSCGVALMQFS